MGQKQPATQWSSQSWECSRLEQVSAQGEPHSRYSVFWGHVWAVGRGTGPRHGLPASGARRDSLAGPGPRGALTAEVGAPPVQGLPPGVGALAGVLGEGVAETAGQVGLLAAAEIMLTGVQVAAGIHQGGTAWEQLAEHLLADALGDSREPAQSRHRRSPGSQPPPCTALHSGTHGAGRAVHGGLRDGVLTLLHGAVHLLQVPKLDRAQPDICRKHSAGLFVGSYPPRTWGVLATPASPSTPPGRVAALESRDETRNPQAFRAAGQRAEACPLTASESRGHTRPGDWTVSPCPGALSRLRIWQPHMDGLWGASWAWQRGPQDQRLRGVWVTGKATAWWPSLKDQEAVTGSGWRQPSILGEGVCTGTEIGGPGAALLRACGGGCVPVSMCSVCARWTKSAQGCVRC